MRPRRAWPGLEEREAGQEDSPRVYLELTVVAPGTEDDVSVRLKNKNSSVLNINIDDKCQIL